jgi:histidinol dehydrogenase
MSNILSVPLRFAGRLADLPAADRTALFDRSTSGDDAIRRDTAAIIAEVQRDGDDALVRLAERFDGATLSSLEVPRIARRRALDAIDRAVLRAMERAASNIATVHAASLPTTTTSEPEPGIVVTRRPDALSRVGVYAPGGRAAYPSSVLMCAVPARVAGVAETVVCSPPDASGLPSPLVLAAAEIAGVDRVFAIGGAGAIAAMALGTNTVPRVDRVVGPGNAYVAEAKLQLCGFVAIDAPAGPSELVIIADDSVNPAAVVAEMIAQAEHDPAACVVALVFGDAAAERIVTALADACDAQPRRTIIGEALATRGAVLAVDSLSDAIAFANTYAAEHLLLAVGDAASLVPQIRNAGTVFVGERSSVSFGDYMSGANHVLPTGGLARSYSGLSTLDFFRWTTVQTIQPRAACALGGDVALFADAEGLAAHATAARIAGAESVS